MSGTNNFIKIPPWVWGLFFGVVGGGGGAFTSYTAADSQSDAIIQRVATIEATTAAQGERQQRQEVKLTQLEGQRASDFRLISQKIDGLAAQFTTLEEELRRGRRIRR